jgi:RNA ligase
MKRYPSTPHADDAPALFERGHLWIQEKIDGVGVRFQLQESGVIRVGDRERVYEPEEIPASLQHLIRHLRENLDREALRAAVGDVESVVFFGDATVKCSIGYEWERMPPFLGYDIWDGDDERFLPPDAVEKVYERLGLHPVNPLQKEVRAVDFDPDSYEIPRSNWYDGAAAGVVLRNKTDGRAELTGQNAGAAADVEPVRLPADEAAKELTTDRRFRRVAADVEARNQGVTVDTLYDRVFEDIVREEYDRLFHDAAEFDEQAFRSELAALTAEFVAKRSA